MSAGIATHRILVGRPMVRRRAIGDGWYAAVRYANGVTAIYAETQAGAMDAGRKAVREAMFCRCSEYGPIYMRVPGQPLGRFAAVAGGPRAPKTIEVRLR